MIFLRNVTRGPAFCPSMIFRRRPLRACAARLVTGLDPIRQSIPIMRRGGGGCSMLTHAQIWSAIDRLAARAGLSASGLARRAGLDPTTFNKSKRMTSEGRARWPSTKSIAKALTATGDADRGLRRVDQSGGNSDAASRAAPRLRAGRQPAAISTTPAFRSARAGTRSPFRKSPTTHAYALKMSGHSMQPAYRDGDVILVSPAAPMRRADRVVVRTRSGEVLVKELKRRTPSRSSCARSIPSTPTARWRRARCSGSRAFCGRANRCRRPSF